MLQGGEVDGQVLVLHDMLGITQDLVLVLIKYLTICILVIVFQKDSLVIGLTSQDSVSCIGLA